MSKQSKNTIKNWFKNGAFPNQFHFWDWMDSFFHKDEQIPASQIDQLQDLLDAKVDRKDLPDGEMAMDDIYGLNSALDAKVDKEDGKGLSTEDFSSELKTKLDSLEEGANKYEHPLTHSANMIEETADKAFTSDAEKLANANHIANTDIHKTSEQIRSEIVDGDIPVSIARQSDVVTSADGVLSAILGGVSESYDTLKKVYDWIFVHDGNTDIHKTSEQIRSEIVDEDIPESIARLTDLKTSSDNVIYDWNVANATPITPVILDLDMNGLAEHVEVLVSRDVTVNFTNPQALSSGTIIFNNTTSSSRNCVIKVDGSTSISVRKLKVGTMDYSKVIAPSYKKTIMSYTVGTDGIPNFETDQNPAQASGNSKSIWSYSTEATVDGKYKIVSINVRDGANFNKLNIQNLAAFDTVRFNIVNNSTIATQELTIACNTAPAMKRDTVIRSLAVGEQAFFIATSISTGTAVYETGAAGVTPTLQEVTDVGVITDQALTLTGGVRTSADTSERFGYLALANDDGSNNNNNAFGYQAGTAITTGAGNTAMGFRAMLKNSTGNYNTGIGHQALEFVTGHRNTSVGAKAGEALSSGDSNTAVGYQSLEANNTGSQNCAIGRGALRFNKASYNTACGVQALVGNTTGSYNTSVGQLALYGITTESNNTAIGVEAGRYPSSTNCTYVGYKASIGGSQDVFANSTSIGANSAVTADNQVVLGDSSVTEVYSYGTLNTNAASPLASAPGGVNAASGLVLTSDGVGGSSWQAAGGGSTPTLQTITAEGATTDQALTFTNALDVYTVDGDNPETGTKFIAFLTESSDGNAYSNMGLSSNQIDIEYSSGGNEHNIRLNNQGIALGSSIIRIGSSSRANENKQIVVNNGDANEPVLRFNETSNIWEYSNNGVDFNPLGGGGSTPTLQEVTAIGATSPTSISVTGTGTVTASNFILSSDERLKTFKEESVVDVSSVDIKKFNYKNDETNRDRYGVSAQELRGVAPEMVYEDDDEDKTLRVAYIDFLLAEISNLRDRLNKLEG